MYFEPPTSTRFHRLVYSSNETDIEGLSPGMLLDDQCGMRMKPHETKDLEDQIKRCTLRALNWSGCSGILYDEGKTGVLKGLGTEIYPDGS